MPAILLVLCGTRRIDQLLRQNYCNHTKIKTYNYTNLFIFNKLMQSISQTFEIGDTGISFPDSGIFDEESHSILRATSVSL